MNNILNMKLYKDISSVVDDDIVRAERKLLKLSKVTKKGKRALTEIDSDIAEDLTEILYYLSIGVSVGIFSIFCILNYYINLPPSFLSTLAISFISFFVITKVYLLFSTEGRIKSLENFIIMSSIKRNAKKRGWSQRDIIKYYFDKG